MRSRFHRGLSALALVAVLAPAPVTARRSPLGQDQIQTPRYGNDRGQCRTPAALPQLGAETWQQQGQNDYPVSHPVPRAVMEKGMTATPPPPAPPPVMAESADSGEIVTTARRADGGSRAKAAEGRAESTRDVARPDRIMPPRPWPRPRPQSGLLTAGEHDDLLNPELYAAYVRRSNLGQEIPALPQLDTARVLTVEVRDRGGAPLGLSSVEVLCEDGNRLVLSTMADGTVTLFPGLDRLSPTVRIRAGGQDWRTVSIPRGAGGQRVTFTTNSINQNPPPKLDLMLAIDTTGSMGDEIRYLQSELAAILNGIRARHPGLDVRVGFVFYRDLGDDYVTNTVPLTRDFNAAQAELRQRYASGGGDYPEAMEQALIRAAGQPWRRDAVKSLLLVADAPPQDENFGTAWLAAEHLRAKRVHIVPVAASGVADKAEYAMRAMAALTQSRYTFLTDDSGIGNPHAPPAIDCYLVTRLNDLLRRVIDSQLSGRRIEPGRQEVIREVGQYDKGRCIIPRGGLQDG